MTAACALAGKQDGVLSLAQCRQVGGSADAVDLLVRTGRWRSVAHDVYQPIPAEPIARRGWIRAGVLSYGATAFAVLGSAAELHGLCVPNRRHVDVAVTGEAARRRQPSAWLLPHQFVRSPSELVERAGIPATGAVRTVADLACRLRRMDAVALLDSALHRGVLVPDDLASVERCLWRQRGAVAARRNLAECSIHGQSPLETHIRLCCIDNGLAPEALQYPVCSHGGVLLGYADLAWPSRRVAIEADGCGPHGLPAALLSDRRRQNDFSRAGWTILRFTWDDLAHGAYIPTTIRATLSRVA